MKKGPVMLCILDGWGLRDEEDHNALALAKTPVWDKMLATSPVSSLQASGLAVGLPEGQMGNSEVGHLNIGSGRIVYQDLTRINKSIQEGDFFENPVLIEAMDQAKAAGKKVHLMGLLSDGGVHSHIDQIKAMVKLAKNRGVTELYVHALLDGRDVPPRSALGYVADLEETMDGLGLGQLATVAGRYYTMDRDKRWDRVEKGYRAMVLGEGLSAPSASQAIEEAYLRGENDEFILPTVIQSSDQGADANKEGGPGPRARIEDGDSLIFCNFRADRAREISRAFVQADFEGFKRPDLSVHYVCLTQYEEVLKAPIAYPAISLDETLGQVLAQAGLKQLRIAETEKYAHVTFFFNGGVDEPNVGETRILVPSPSVATYDLQPEMSALEVTDRLVEAVEADLYDVIILNYANPDMVGHTGILPAAIKAVETVDACLGRVLAAISAKEGSLFVTADHGNCEVMLNPETKKPHTAHTSNLVPFVLATAKKKEASLADGSLRDIAPTLLDVLGISQPEEMTGTSLVK